MISALAANKNQALQRTASGPRSWEVDVPIVGKPHVFGRANSWAFEAGGKNGATGRTS